LCNPSLASVCREIEENEEHTVGEQPGASDTLPEPFSDAQEMDVLTASFLEVKKGFMMRMIQPIFQVREEQRISKEVSV
jgi:hypothetical protein